MALALALLYPVYIVVLFAGGVAKGVPRDPFLAAAEVLTISGAVLQVALFATIDASAPRRAKVFTRQAFAWMVVMAALTTSVHFVELTVSRRVDRSAAPALDRIFGWEWPSLLYGVELAAWHVFFGLALLCAAPAFPGRGAQAVVRTGLIVGGLLCLAGVVGPAIGDLRWRLFGALGYAVVFPVVCAFMTRAIPSAASGGSTE